MSIEIAATTVAMFKVHLEQEKILVHPQRKLNVLYEKKPLR